MKARSAREAFVLLGACVCAVIVLLAIAGALDVDEQSYIDQIDPPVYAVDPPVTSPAREPVPAPHPTVLGEEGAADAVLVPDSLAAPLVTRQTQVTDAPASAPPVPAGGDCSAWAEVFRHYGATDAEVSFFVPRIIDRETGCGRDTLNDRTGDSGVCQISPVHNRAGYFGRSYFGDGGWLGELHGLETRVDTDATAWTAACLTLYRVCGTGPWQPPYSCANRPLPVLNPEGTTS